MELADRIAHFLDTGEVRSAKAVKKRAAVTTDLCEDTKIEADFVCSERHRMFLKSILETV